MSVLPHHRRSGNPPDATERLPRQRKGTTPQMIGRYPDYDVLDPSIVRTWDEETRRVVMARLALGERSFEFFRSEEIPTLRAFCDTVMAQESEPRIPVPEMLDRKYAAGELDGYQYADMPDDRETWHLVLRGLDFTARSRYGSADFAALDAASRQAIVQDFQDAVLSGGEWERLNVTRAFSVCLRGILAEFYSHPWAWNEIGFGGPAYPRGFMAFGQVSVREPFETPDALGLDPVRDVEERLGL